MLWTVFVLLLVLWALGWGFHVADSTVHFLLVLALIVAVLQLLVVRRRSEF